MIKNSSALSFRQMYLQAHDDLEKALKGKEYESNRLDLNKIYQATNEFYDEICATLDSKVVNPERSLTKAYYEVVCYCLLKYKDLLVNYRYSHWETDPFIKVSWCFDQLKNLAEEIRKLAEDEGLQFKRFSDLNRQRDYAIGFTYNRNGKEEGFSIPGSPNNQEEQTKLSLSQIALKFVYESNVITRENGGKIAKRYGHSSGDKLYLHFNYYHVTANRKGKPDGCTKLKLKNKIKLLDSVIELLPKDKREKALDEVGILKNIYESEYQ